MSKAALSPASDALMVTHVAEDMAPMAGGVPAVVRQLSRRLADTGAHLKLVHATGDASDLDPIAEVFPCAPSRAGQVWSYGPSLAAALKLAIPPHEAGPTVVHVHGVWSAPQWMAMRTARAHRQPWLLTAHGMLEPWLWRQQGWRVRAKKAAYWNAMLRPLLANSAVFHAITPLERAHLLALVPDSRVEIIPNAIEMLPVPAQAPQLVRSVLFLGRIEPIKGVDILIEAFAQAGLKSEWTLQVVGPAWSQVYLDSLRAQVDRLQLTARVSFLGPKFGLEKTRLLQSAWVMVAPSHSEVVGLVNLEAAERQVPSITTYQTGLADWLEGGGDLVQPELNEVAQALVRACAWSDSERAARGAASRALVQRRYSWDATIPQWQALYSDINQEMRR